jgi:hypothetical protein
VRRIKHNNTGAFAVVSDPGQPLLSQLQPQNRQFANHALYSFFLVILTPGLALAQSQGNKSTASRTNDRPKIQARLTDDENLRQRLNRPYDRTDERIMRAPKAPAESSLKINGQVSGKVYVFETSESFAPDFLAAGASLGVKGNQGPFGGTLEVSLAEKANRVGVTKGLLRRIRQKSAWVAGTLQGLTAISQI